jgi:uncharacterized protein (TIGR02391 family)
MPVHPSLPPAELESVCRVLADTTGGLTGTEIGNLLSLLGIRDPAAGITKWKRLFAALSEQQQRDRCGNNVLRFILEGMKPVRYVGQSAVFEARRLELNQVLAFMGVELGNDGQLRTRQAARTLTEAEERAGRLKAELVKRSVHPDVLRFCRAELLQDNYFHAVLEATKSVADKIRAKTGLTGDGADLVDQALALGKSGMPFLAFNSLRTESEQSEQKGLLNLMKGIFGTFRSPTAHAPRLSWNMTEQDALDLLTMASFLHRRLDSAVRTPRTA